MALYHKIHIALHFMAITDASTFIRYLYAPHENLIELYKSRNSFIFYLLLFSLTPIDVVLKYISLAYLLEVFLLPP